MLKILTCSAKLSHLCYSCCFLFSAGKPITAGERKMQPYWLDCHHRDENQNTGILQNIKRIYLVLISLSWIHSPAFVSICATLWLNSLCLANVQATNTIWYFQEAEKKTTTTQ